MGFEIDMDVPIAAVNSTDRRRYGYTTFLTKAFVQGKFANQHKLARAHVAKVINANREFEGTAREFFDFIKAKLDAASPVRRSASPPHAGPAARRSPSPPHAVAAARRSHSPPAAAPVVINRGMRRQRSSSSPSSSAAAKAGPGSGSSSSHGKPARKRAATGVPNITKLMAHNFALVERPKPMEIVRKERPPPIQRPSRVRALAGPSREEKVREEVKAAEINKKKKREERKTTKSYADELADLFGAKI